MIFSHRQIWEVAICPCYCTFPAECWLNWETSVKPQGTWPWDLQALLSHPPSYLLCLIKASAKLKKWYWDEIAHFCNGDGWVFKYARLLLALPVSICGHSSSSTCTNIYGAWPPLTCAEACFASFSLSYSGKHLQVSQDTSLKQLEQLPGL